MKNPVLIFKTLSGSFLYFTSDSSVYSHVFRLAKETISRIENEAFNYSSVSFSCDGYETEWSSLIKGYVIKFESGRSAHTNVLREERNFNRNYGEDYLDLAEDQDSNLTKNELLEAGSFVECINLLTEIK